jgi:hypothetical protein
MMKTKDRPVKVRVNIDDVMKKQLSADEIEYYEDESYDEKKTTNLLQMKRRDLPCPSQYREQLEHPSTREFIGFDLSWIHSSSSSVWSRSYWNVLVLTLTIKFLCTFTAFFR